MPDEPTPDTFRTVADRGEAGLEVRGSTFEGRVAPVDDVDAAEAFVKDVRAAKPDATHHVPAYRVRAGDGRGDLLREWSSDVHGSAAPVSQPESRARFW